MVDAEITSTYVNVYLSRVVSLPRVFFCAVSGSPRMYASPLAERADYETRSPGALVS